MKIKFQYLFSYLLIIMVFPVIVQSQTANKPPDRMKFLAAFNGEWKGEMVIQKEKKKVKYKMSHTSEKIAGGWGIQLSEVAMIPDKGKYQVARIFSVSSVNDTTYMYAVDNFGDTRFYEGVWETNKKLLLKTIETKEGKQLNNTITYTFLSPKIYEYRSITHIEGLEDEIVEMKMERQ